MIFTLAPTIGVLPVLTVRLSAGTWIFGTGGATAAPRGAGIGVTAAAPAAFGSLLGVGLFEGEEPAYTAEGGVTGAGTSSRIDELARELAAVDHVVAAEPGPVAADGRTGMLQVSFDEPAESVPVEAVEHVIDLAGAAERDGLRIELGGFPIEQVEQAEAHAAVASLRDVYDPRRLRAGQQLALTALSGAEETRRGLLRLAFDLDFDHQIEVTRGTVDFAVDCAPRFDYARESPAVEGATGGVRFVGRNLAMRLHASVPLVSAVGAATARFRLHAGEQAWFVLGEDTLVQTDDDAIVAEIAATTTAASPSIVTRGNTPMYGTTRNRPTSVRVGRSSRSSESMARSSPSTMWARSWALRRRNCERRVTTSTWCCSSSRKWLLPSPQSPNSPTASGGRADRAVTSSASARASSVRASSSEEPSASER